MATKVNPWNGKGLGKESVRKQFTTSLESMKVEKVQILYLHAPDHDTPLLETLTEINEIHKEGKFAELGLSNYSAWVSPEMIGFNFSKVVYEWYNCVGSKMIFRVKS